MEGVSETIKPILDKVIDFFHIFDLSYIISGFATTTSIYIWMDHHDAIPTITLTSKQLIVVGIMSCYVLGLLSFSVGRFFRRYIYNNIARRRIWHKVFTNLNVEENFQFVNRLVNANMSKEQFDLECIKKWDALRSDDSKKVTYNHLNRYWVMTATTDGLTFSSIVSFILIFSSSYSFCNCMYFCLFLTCAGIAVISFTRQANKSELNQTKELFITIP